MIEAVKSRCLTNLERSTCPFSLVESSERERYLQADPSGVHAGLPACSCGLEPPSDREAIIHAQDETVPSAHEAMLKQKSY